MPTYRRELVITFCKTKDPFGGLSNMAGGYPLEVARQTWRTSEALYQAMRFPDHGFIQKMIMAEKSPMAAKMVAKAHILKSRPDWDNVRTRVMAWALRIKWSQHAAFRELLETTEGKLIVEESHKDRYWGAVKEPHDHSQLTGENVLGRMLVDLRGLRHRKPASLNHTPTWDRALFNDEPITV